MEHRVLDTHPSLPLFKGGNGQLQVNRIVRDFQFFANDAVRPSRHTTQIISIIAFIIF